MNKYWKIVLFFSLAFGSLLYWWNNALCCGIPVSIKESEKDLFPPHAGIMGFSVNLHEIDYPIMEERIGKFQSNNNVDGLLKPLCFNFGYQRYRNIVEIDMFGGFNRLGDFMDEDHNFSVDLIRALFWYRRVMLISRKIDRLRILPGVGIGYSTARAYISMSEVIAEERRDLYNDETVRVYESPLLESSRISVGTGIRVEFRVVKWKKGKSGQNGAIYLGFDYRYYFDDMRAKTVNEGDIFFPGGSEFEIAGHCFAVDFKWYIY